MMVFFLPILGWSFLEPLGWSVGSARRITCNLHRKDDLAGVCQPPLRWLSQFISYEKERIQLFYGIITAYLFVVEWVDIYKGK